MTCRHATLPITFALILCFVCSASSGAWAQAGTITKGMQDNCANDYRKFCGDYGLQTSALNLCMTKAGTSLSPACAVRSLIAFFRPSVVCSLNWVTRIKPTSSPSRRERTERT